VVGGHGIGNDLDLSSGFGHGRRPVFVRFAESAVLVAAGVDDDGTVSCETFWDEIGANPEGVTVQRIVDALVGLLERGSKADAEFSRKKWEVCRTFEALIKRDGLLSPDVDVAAGINGEVAQYIEDIESGRDVERPGWLLEPTPGVFTFPLFSKAFCERLVALLDAFEKTDLPRRRPNTMNNYGLILNEIGLGSFSHSLLDRVVAPLSRKLFERETFATSLDHTHTFTVEYEVGKDTGLDMHHDASEVTLNVCLGKDFRGGGLRFCGSFGSADYRKNRLTVAHERGRAVLHLGRVRHAAADVEGGERVNLIVWARSSAFRAAAAYGHIKPDGYPKEKEGEVDLICLSKANDADYEERIRGGPRVKKARLDK